MIHSCCTCKPNCPGIFLITDKETGDIKTYRCFCQSCHSSLFHLWDLLAKAILEKNHMLYLKIDCQIKLRNRQGPFEEVAVMMETWKEWQSLNEEDYIWAARWLASGITTKTPAF